MAEETDEQLDNRTGQPAPDVSVLRQRAVMTLAEVASVLRCSREEVRLLALEGKIPGHFRLGRSHRVSTEPFFRWLDSVNAAA